MKIANIIISLLIIAFSVTAYVYTLSFPKSAGDDVGPAFVPKIFILIIIILGIILLLKSLFFNNEQSAPFKKKIAIFIFLFIIYNLVISILGFYFSTVLFLVALLLMNSIKKVVYYIFVPTGVVLFVFVFFEKLLNVPLPTGIFL